MDAAAALQDVLHLDLHHLAPRERGRDGLERRLVGRVLEGRHHDAAVGDVEVDVGKAEPSPVVAGADGRAAC